MMPKRFGSNGDEPIPKLFNVISKSFTIPAIQACSSSIDLTRLPPSQHQPPLTVSSETLADENRSAMGWKVVKTKKKKHEQSDSDTVFQMHVCTQLFAYETSQSYHKTKLAEFE